jgi:hypothetical protein
VRVLETRIENWLENRFFNFILGNQVGHKHSTTPLLYRAQHLRLIMHSLVAPLRIDRDWWTGQGYFSALSRDKMEMEKEEQRFCAQNERRVEANYQVIHCISYLEITSRSAGQALQVHDCLGRTSGCWCWHSLGICVTDEIKYQNLKIEIDVIWCMFDGGWRVAFTRDQHPEIGNIAYSASRSRSRNLLCLRLASFFYHANMNIGLRLMLLTRYNTLLLEYTPRSYNPSI